MPSLRAVRSLELVALLVTLGAAVAGIVVWSNGTVSLGLTLDERAGRVYVYDVTPDGNAVRSYLFPNAPIVEITTVDGSSIELGPTLREVAEELADDYGIPRADVWQDGLLEGIASYGEYGPYGGYSEPGPFDPDQRMPAEPVDPARIATIVAAEVDPTCCIGIIAMMDRSALELKLRQSIWTAVIGLLLGGLLWRLLAHGIAGREGRASAIVAGASVATPFLILPAVVAGTPAGIAAGYLVSAAASLPLGLRIAAGHPDRQWAQTARMASLVAAGLAAVVVIQYLTSPTLQNDRTVLLVLVASIAGVPAAISAMSVGRPTWDRVPLVAVGLVPAAAIMLIASSAFDPTTAIILLSLLVIAMLVAVAAARGGNLLGARLPTMPIGRGLDAVNRRLDDLRGQPAVTREPADPSIVATRDVLTYGLIGVSIFLSLATPVGGWDPVPMGGGWPIVLGVGLAALVGFAIRRGFLGEDWTDAAVPLAAAVGVPILLVNGLAYYGRTPFAVIPTALAALSVAHVLAMRHADPIWRARLFGASVGLVVVIGLLAVVAGLESVATVLVGLVALIPGRIAFASERGEVRALTSRLETLAVAITPGIAATMLFPSFGLFVLGGWIVAMVVWRRFTLAPLLGLAQRTQLQRDVAVAAAETERARLAADLHDDALQQLTMLVRTLDEKGQTKEADEAREIATKLRSVVGDLRLPILDDLGAGAALEWLVERVEPLAGGPVKLERSDETRPPANVELAVFRVAQEALTNAIKHGKPPIAVRYDVRTDGRVTLAIDDAGEGIGSEAAEEAPKEGHFGLVNMQQRAEQIGALLDVRRWPSGGTRVALEWRPQ